MALAYKSTVPLSGLAVPLFILFASVIFELTLQLSALISLSLSFGISFSPPTIAIALGIAVALSAAFTLALGLSLPSFNVNLALAFSFELAIVLGLLVELELLLALADVGLLAYGWFGTPSALGGALTAQVGGGWPDGTGSEQSVTAYLFVATASSGFRPDEVESLALLAAPPPPPAPTTDPPPDGTYPPPQAYETGLASVTISPPPPGGVQATGTVTVDDSVSTGIGAITGVSISDHGSGYTSPPTISITDTVAIVSATTALPAVLTLPRALTIPIGDGFGVSVTDASTPPTTTAATAKVLSPTTVALYADADFTQPITGAFSGGTLTGGGAGAAALATMGGGSQQALKTLLDGLRWPNVPGVLEGGKVTFRSMLPGAFATLDALGLNLKARASLLGGVSVGVSLLPPSVSASIDLLANIAANLTANLNAQLPDLSVSMGAALDAQLAAAAKLAASVGLYMGIAGLEVEVWEYTGPGSGLGAAVAAGPGTMGWHDGTPPAVPVVAAVIGLTNPAASAAFGTFFPV